MKRRFTETAILRALGEEKTTRVRRIPDDPRDLTSNQQTITYLRAVVHEILRIGLERMGLQSQDVNRILGHITLRSITQTNWALANALPRLHALRGARGIPPATPLRSAPPVMEEFVAGRWGGLRRPAISRLTELDLSIPTLAAEQLGIHPILASRLREGFDVDHRELTGDAAAMRALLAVGDIWNVRGMARVLGRKAPAEVLALVRMDVTAQLEALHKNVRRLLGAGGGAIAMLPGYSPQQAGSVWRLELVSAAASAGGADQGAELCAGIHGLPSVVVVDPPLGMPRLGPIRAARVGGPETVDLTVQPGVWPLAFSGVFDGEVRTLGGLGMPSQADVADTVGDVLLSPLAKIVASYSVSLELTRDIRFYS